MRARPSWQSILAKLTPELIEEYRIYHDKNLKMRIETEKVLKAVVKSKVFVREIEVEDGEELVGE